MIGSSDLAVDSCFVLIETGQYCEAENKPPDHEYQCFIDA